MAGWFYDAVELEETKIMQMYQEMLMKTILKFHRLVVLSYVHLN